MSTIDSGSELEFSSLGKKIPARHAMGSDVIADRGGLQELQANDFITRSDQRQYDLGMPLGIYEVARLGYDDGSGQMLGENWRSTVRGETLQQGDRASIQDVALRDSFADGRNFIHVHSRTRQVIGGLIGQLSTTLGWMRTPGPGKGIVGGTR